MDKTDSTPNHAAASCKLPTPRAINKSLVIVEPENPLETLPFISDVLIFMGACLQQQPGLNSYDRTETGAGIMLDLLAYAIDDVQVALEEKERRSRA